MKRKSAFTLVELLVVVGIIALLAAAVLPTLARSLELARRTKCKGNLNAIIKSAQQYANENANNGQGDIFPLANPAIAGTSFIGANYNQEKPSSNIGTSRSLFLLVRKGASVKQFVCPSTDHAVNKDIDPDLDWDFRSEKDLSYSFQVQKNGAPGDGRDGRWTFLHDPSSKIVLADRSPISGIDSWSASGGGRVSNPGSGTLSGFGEKLNNSFNHEFSEDREGQNVARVDGSCAWSFNPRCGAEDAFTGKPDNIWCWWSVDGDGNKTDDAMGAGVSSAVPAHELDSFLWP